MVDTLHNYILELHYVAFPTGKSPMAHVTRSYIRVDAEVFPGEDFDTIGLITGNGLDQSLSDLTDDAMTVFDDLFNTTTDFGRWEVWKQPVGTKDRTWIATKEIGLPGTHANPTIGAGQLIYTFRCSDGKYMKVSLQETVIGEADRVIPPYAGVHLALANHYKSLLQSYTNVYNCTKVLANISYNPGKNEEIFKKRYRS